QCDPHLLKSLRRPEVRLRNRPAPRSEQSGLLSSRMGQLQKSEESHRSASSNSSYPRFWLQCNTDSIECAKQSRPLPDAPRTSPKLADSIAPTLPDPVEHPEIRW